MPGKKNIVYGEYDPPYNFNSNPTEEQRKAAQKVIEKYEKMAADRKKASK